MRRVAALAAPLLALLALLALSAQLAPVQAAVMGIDFGSEFIKVASVKPGTPFHIVVDEQSKRKVPAVVAFDQGERYFGNGAVQLAMRKPKETYLWAHRLLGKDIQSPQVAQLRRMGFPWEIVELPDRRTLGFRHAAAKGDAPEVVFSVEEIVAMSLQHVMKIAEADAESPVKDCVLTVPPYWTHRERQAMLDAAEIAGLNVLSLLNENTAAAIQYGIDRKYSVNETHTIMLYNMGSTSTKVGIATYTGFLKKERGGKSNKTVGQFDMRGQGYDESLGGSAFEQRLADFVAVEVNKQLAAKGLKHDIYTNAKAMAKIRSAAEKAKTVLSANQESQVFLNSLYEDTDFKLMITREQFLELCDDLIKRVSAPMEQALLDAGVSMEEVDAVIIIGGGVRVPAVQAAIKQFSGKEHLTQSLNGDEAMVMGAVFRAANLSTTFQVRPFGMNDESPFAVSVRITSDVPATTDAAVAVDDEDAAAATPAEGEKAPASAGFSKRASLFKRHNRLAKKKTVQFNYTADFQTALSHDAVAGKGLPLPAGIPLPLDSYNVTGLTKLVESPSPKYAELLAAGKKPKVSLSFLLDSSGVTTLTRAEATLEEMVKVPKPKPKPAAPKVNATATATANATDSASANATETAGAEGDAEKNAAEATPEAEKKEETPAAAEGEEKKDEAATDAAAADGEKKDDASAEKKDDEPEFTLKKKTHTIPLLVSKNGSPGSVESMNATHRLLARATLEKLRRADDLKKEIAAAKNTLEAYIYATRAAIQEADVEPVSTEAQREEIVSALAASEDWLYEQGDDSAKIFKDKLSELKALSDPVFFRLAEVSALPTALNTTRTLIKFVAKQLADIEKNKPWVPEADRKKLSDSVSDLEEWLAGKEAAQAKLSPVDTPVLESEALYERLRPIHKLSNDVSKLKKPADPKPKTAKTTGKGGKKNDTASSNTTAGADDEEGKGKSSEAEGEAKSTEQKDEENASAEGEGAGSTASEGEEGAAEAGAGAAGDEESAAGDAGSADAESKEDL